MRRRFVHTGAVSARRVRSSLGWGGGGEGMSESLGGPPGVNWWDGSIKTPDLDKHGMLDEAVRAQQLYSSSPRPEPVPLMTFIPMGLTLDRQGYYLVEE